MNGTTRLPPTLHPRPVSSKTVTSIAPSDSVRTSSAKTAIRMLEAAQASRCSSAAIKNAALNYKNPLNSALDSCREWIASSEAEGAYDTDHISSREMHDHQDHFKRRTAEKFYIAIKNCSTDKMSYEIYFDLPQGKEMIATAVIENLHGNIVYYETTGNNRCNEAILFEKQSIADFKEPKSPTYSAELLSIQY